MASEAPSGVFQNTVVTQVSGDIPERWLFWAVLTSQEQALIPGGLRDEGSFRASSPPAVCLPGLRSSRAEQQLPTGSVLHWGPSSALCWWPWWGAPSSSGQDGAEAPQLDLLEPDRPHQACRAHISWHAFKVLVCVLRAPCLAALSWEPSELSLGGSPQNTLL